MRQRCLMIGAMSLALAGVGLSTARATEEKEEHEQKISLKEAPSAVRKTLAREADGEQVKTVDKEILKGKTVYEADVKIDGHNYEIVIDEDGILQSKKLDAEENAKPEDNERNNERKVQNKTGEKADDDHGVKGKDERKPGERSEK